MTWLQWYALGATAGLFGLAVHLFRLSRRIVKWIPPVLDPGRYQVVQHYLGETREIAHGFDPIAARHAYENAPIQAGVVIEFLEWGQCRGKREA